MRDIGRIRKSGTKIDFRERPIVCRLLWVVALMFFVGSSPAAAAYVAPESIEGATRVTAEELIEMAATMAELVVVDARKKSDWEDGHIDGTVHLVNSDMTGETLAAVASRDQPVVFYCNGPGCYRSGDASIKAVGWGWTKVYWFRGGIEEWTTKDYPLTK